METFKAGIRIAAINMHRWKKDYRIWLIFASTAVLVLWYLLPYIQYSLDNGKTVTFCLLPLLYVPARASIASCKILWHIGFLVLLCDAPFVHETAPYMFLRGGRKSRFAGEVIYIFWTAAVYMLFITLVSMVAVLPVAGMENDWGNGITDFLFGSEKYTGEQLMELYPIKAYLPGGTIKFLYPFASEAYTFFAGLGCMFILGLLLYLVSMVFDRAAAGLAAAGGMVFLAPLLTWRAEGSKYYIEEAFSPVCWTSIEHLDLLEPYYFFSIPFVAAAETILIVVLMVLIYIVNKRSAIEVKV